MMKVGDVIRFGQYAFADGVVTHVYDDGTFDVQRPYAYASDTSNVALVAVERVCGLPANSTFEHIDSGRIR